MTYDGSKLPSGQANKTITERGATYGHPHKNFVATAELVTTQLRTRGLLKEGAKLDPLDIAQIMRLVKEARLFESPRHDDSLVDICGYADCAQLVKEREDDIELGGKLA